MNLVNLLDICRDRNIELWSEGGALCYRAPEGALDEALKVRLRSERAALLDHLSDGIVWCSDLAAANERFPLTPVQAAYVLGRNAAFDYGGNACHLYAEYRWPKDMDPRRLEEAWNAVVGRHPMLRAVIEENAWQRVLSEVPWQALQVHDRRNAGQSAFDTHLEEVRDRLDHESPVLDQWPVLRPELTCGPEVCVLHMSVDFTIVDYASLQLLLREWWERYHDPDRSPAPLEATFRDYVMVERGRQDSAQWRADRQWWQERLDTLPGRPDLPLRGHPDTRSTRFRHLHAHLDEVRWEAFCAQSGILGLSASGVVIAAFAEVIGRWSQTPAFCLNLTVLNRPPWHPQLAQVLGDFTTLSLLAVDGREGTSFAERARRIGQRMFDDLDHATYSAVDVMRDLSRSHGRGADLMPVVFTSGIGSIRRLLDGTEGSSMVPRSMISQTPQVWLDCQVTDQFGGLEIGWDVREGLFPDGLPEAMFEDFTDVLRRLSESPDLWGRDIRTLFVEDSTPSSSPQPLPGTARSIAAGFAERARLTPDAPVIHDGTGAHSYRRIAQWASAVRHELQSKGVGHGQRVAVMLPKSAWQLIAVMGVIEAGAAYIPLDIRQPVARRQTILANAQASALICLETDPFETDCPRLAVDRLSPDSSWPPPAAEAVSPDDPAYVIYTSGSTGTPKGVMLSHAAVSNTLCDINERYGVNADDRLLGLAELSFDLSVYDMFGATAAGAQVILPDPARGADPSHWADLMRRHGVTLWNSVPAQGQMLIDYLDGEQEEDIPGPRCVLWSGDWIPTSLPTRWWTHWPQSRLFSLGGATEAAIWSIEQPIRAEHTGLSSIPYGRALRGQSVEVLDALGRRCPPGVRGEIHIGGVGLALGYAGDPERTAERFITHPDGRRLYRTGDMGRTWPDGTIEFLGREDDQVKIRGHRIELADLDTALSAHPGVKEAATIVLGETHQRSLASFIVPKIREEGDAAARERLRAVGKQAAQVLVRDWGDLAAVGEAVTRLDRACLASLAAWVSTSGVLTSTTPLDFAILGERLEVPDAHRRLLAHWLRQLDEGGYLEAVDQGWRGRSDRPDLDPETAWDRFADVAPARLWPADLVTYLRRSASSLAEQLAGEINPATLMFPEGSPHIAEAMYSDGLHAQALHEAVAEAVGTIVEGQPKRRWRLLELGAGTAAASRAVITRLAPLVEQGVSVDYLFTDVSSYFLAAARDRFSKYPWVRFARFDMNGDPLDQGVAPHSVDLLLSSGALNNARNTPRMLAGLRHLTTAESWLVIQELTREHNEISISQSLMMEIPNDSRADDHQLFIHAPRWLTWLAAEPGDMAISLAEPGSALDLLGYDVLLARWKTDRWQLDPTEVMAFAETRVPRYMLPSRLRVLDRLPVTANGKIDRKVLVKLASQSSFEAPREMVSMASLGALEQGLLGLWREVLDTPDLGVDQDFFTAGGDSLLIAQLIARVRATVPEAREQSFDRLLRWAMSHPTARGMAACLREVDGASGNNHASRSVVRKDGAGEAEERRADGVAQTRAPVHGPGRGTSSLVRLVEGEGVPLVLVHEGLGMLQPYRSVLGTLGQTRPVFGLAVHDSDAYLEIPSRHLNACLGHHYADALQAQGLKTVDVLGYCSGGLVALEMAKALVQRGVEVRGLHIVSSYRIPYRIEDERLPLYSFAATLGLDTTALGFPESEDLAQAITRALEVRADHLSADALACFPELTDVGALRARVLRAASGGVAPGFERGTLYRLFRHSVDASQIATSAPYLGSLCLFVPSDGNPLVPSYRAALEGYWRTAVIGTCDVREIPGGHFTCLGPDLVACLTREKSA